jgi:hypothetical protein
MKTIIFGFGHKARHGKDSACRIIREQLGHLYDIRQYSFAEALKREVIEMGNQRTLCEMVDLPYDENPPMDDPLLPPPHGKQRRLLQWWGTEFRRVKFGTNYWVDRTAARIAADNPQIAVISDMRFKNEFDMVKSNGFTINMQRPDFVYETGMTHASELELDGAPYDFVVRASNMHELEDKVLRLVTGIMPKVQG